MWRTYFEGPIRQAGKRTGCRFQVEGLIGGKPASEDGPGFGLGTGGDGSGTKEKGGRPVSRPRSRYTGRLGKRHRLRLLGCRLAANQRGVAFVT